MQLTPLEQAMVRLASETLVFGYPAQCEAVRYIECVARCVESIERCTHRPHCPDCEGTGKVLAQCGDCDFRHMHACWRCDGTGAGKCRRCVEAFSAEVQADASRVLAQGWPTVHVSRAEGRAA